MLDEIFKGMDNAAEIIDGNFDELVKYDGIIDQKVKTRIVSAGIGANESLTIEAGSAPAFIVGGRQSSGAKILAFYDGFNRMIQYVSPTLIEVTTLGNDVVIKNNSGVHCPLLLVKIV